MKLKSESIGGVGLEHLEECATLQQNITLQQDISLKTTKYLSFYFLLWLY